MSDDILAPYEVELIDMWRKYSEDCWAAGFMEVRPDTVHSFAEWLERRKGEADE